MAYTIPTVSEFQDHFFRDFPYADDDDTDDLSKVQSRDITKAIAEASVNINQGLFSSQDNFTLGFLYLAAHYLVTDLRASSQGIAGNYAWLTASKGAGGVNESFTIPQRILDNPYLAMISKTPYGAKYLSLVLPGLTGAMFTSCGGTYA